MADDGQGRLIPAWLWAALVVLVVALVVALALTDRREEVPASYAYDVQSYAEVDAAKVTFKETGKFPLSVTKPSALALVSDGRLWVAGENAVVALDAEGKETARYAVDGLPECLASSPDGALFAGMRNCIVEIDPKDGSTTAWPVLDERAYLTSLAVDEENVYAADAGNRVVLRFDHAGKLQNRIGERDDARQVPGLVVPSPYLDVAFDPQGSLWVVNPGKHGLENYRPNGDLVSAWYRPSMELDGFCGCCNPMHVAFRRDGSLVTAEKGLDRVKLYAPDNTLLGVVAAPEAFVSNANQGLPCTTEAVIGDIVTDADGRVYVLDKTRDTVRIFEQEAGTP